jgi:hypothetical protein
MFFNSRNKVEINNIKNLCISHVIKIINTLFFQNNNNNNEHMLFL